MGAPDDEVDRLVDRGFRGLDDFLDGRMAAPDDEHDAVRRVDRQRYLSDFEVGSPFAAEQNEVKAGRHFGGLA